MCRDQDTLSCMYVLKKLACPQNTQTVKILLTFSKAI